MNRKEIICYNTDASRLFGNTEKVVFPKSADDVQKIIKTASLDIVPRGAGSGLMGGCIPSNSIVVDMSKMNQVLGFDSRKKTVLVEAGITLKELNEKLKSKGFEFPIELGNQGISSIGGMIATNASGSRSMKYGTMRNWIEEIEFVNGRGELMKTSKADLMDVCGMEGITGIIVKAKLRIIPKVERSASIFQTDNLDEALSIARRLKSEKDVVMLEFFPKEVSKLLGFPEKYHIIIEFDSSRGKMKGKEYKSIQELKDKAYYTLASRGYYSSEDPKLFFDKLKEFILFLENREVLYFGDLGAGIIHPFFKDEEKNKMEEVSDFIRKINAKPGKYGIGLKRKDFLDSFEIKIIHRVKLRHDPLGRLNKGKVIDIDFPKRRSEKRDLGSIQKREVKEMATHIKPFQGEEKTTLQILEELKIPKEKSKGFIGAVEKKKQKGMAGEKIDTEIEKRLIDYKETFNSELADEKRKKVEEFAKNVPKRVNNKSEVSIESAFVKTPAESSMDYNEIKDIMTNKYGFDFNKRQFDDSKEIVTGKVSVTDNLDRKSQKNFNSVDYNKIRDIMTNKFSSKEREKEKSENEIDGKEREDKGKN